MVEWLRRLVRSVSCSMRGLSHLGHDIVPISGCGRSPISFSIDFLCSSNMRIIMLHLSCLPELRIALHIIFPVSLASVFVSHRSPVSTMGKSKNPCAYHLGVRIVQSPISMWDLFCLLSLRVYPCLLVLIVVLLIGIVLSSGHSYLGSV